MEEAEHNNDVQLNNVYSDIELDRSDSYSHGKFSGSTVTFNNICYQVKVKTGFPCKRKTVVREILGNIKFPTQTQCIMKAVPPLRKHSPSDEPSHNSSRFSFSPSASSPAKARSGIMRPGMNAIMGPTGSGKSSLLDILAARKEPTGLKGQVLVDGVPQPADFKCISGYVVQDDVVMGTLTVRENLQFSAALRLPTSIRNKEKNERIDQVIKELGLTKVADTKVGTPFIRGVSGGERKRTNIGMELIIDPSVLFLDEPTTGLDASTAFAVLCLLQRMSRKGRTIIFSIHQPRYAIFKLFGSLTLLANGRLVFHGPSKMALDYFSSIGYSCEAFNNPADFFLDIINGDSTAVSAQPLTENDPEKALDESDLSKEISIAENLEKEFSKSNYYTEMMSELKKVAREETADSTSVSRRITYATSFLHQFKWVARRSYKNLLRSPQGCVAQVMVSTVLGLIVGAIFFGVENNMSGIQNRVGSLFFLTTNLCFTSISVIELFVIEKKIFIHEYISGYYMIISYFFAKLFVDLIPMRTVPSIVFTVITYFMIGFKLDPGAFFFALLTLVQVSITATSLGLAVATGQSIIGIANLIISVLFVIMFIFSGLLVNLPSVANWLSWLRYLSIPYYGFTALEVNEFVGLIFCNDSELVSVPNTGSVPPEVICTGEQYLERQGIEATNWSLWQNNLAMALMMVILFTIAYLKLRFMKKFS